MDLKSKKAAYILGSAILLIIIALLLLHPRMQNKSIRIKTALSPDEIRSKVKLNSGTLYFKTELDVYKEMSEEERNAYKPKPGDYLPPRYGKGMTVTEGDILRVLNIDPTQWRIPDRYSFGYENFDVMVRLVSDEASEEEYSDDVLYSRGYYGEGLVVIEIALPGRRWIRNTEILGLSVQHVKTVYGEMNSRIGDMPLSVLIRVNNAGNQYYDAHFIAGNAAYFVSAIGLTQQEYVELLISIYEAPRPFTEDAMSALYAVRLQRQSG